MNITVSFSGGVSHSKPVSGKVQTQLADAVAQGLKEVLSKNYASGSGAVTIGSANATLSVTSTNDASELDGPEAASEEATAAKSE